VMGDDAIDRECVACSRPYFGPICTTEGVRGKFIGDYSFELGDRGKAARSSRISGTVSVPGGKEEEGVLI